MEPAAKKAATAYETLSVRKVAGGTLTRVKHASAATLTDMVMSVFLPDDASDAVVPTLFYLSGLTCTDENFSMKAGAFLHATKHNIGLVIPDTSPRGANIEGEDASWEVGTGAGFYLDATKEPWSKNYRMYTYITQEVFEFLKANFPRLSTDSVGFTGHSMGGMGALTIAFKNPQVVTSVSAIAPICKFGPSGLSEKAFAAYLADASEAAQYDACELLKGSGGKLPFDDILVDQGDSDEFLEKLAPQSLVAAAQEVGQKLTLRMQKGFDHSYYFVSSFMGDHVAFHAKRLHAKLQNATRCVVDTAVVDTSMTGKPINCKAMVAFRAKEPLTLTDIVVAPPKAGEVRCKVIANALCHTDVYTLSGQDPEGLFPSILGHEAGCIVESVGEGVTSVKPGDHVIPCYTPQCCSPQCMFCQSPKTNLCPKIRGTQGKGLMPDGTSRFTDAKTGEPIFHFMGCSTFAEYTVLAEISCAKIDKAANLSEVCLLGCGVATGLGAVWNNAKVEAGSTVCVFGLGAVGLSVVQGAKEAGASAIFAVDINPSKFDFARKLGATSCVNPKDYDRPIQQVLVEMSPSGYGFDYTFDATGSVAVMRSALECAHRGWGQSCVIGVAPSGHEISTRPFQLVTGRRWLGTAFGGWKSRTDVPKLVERTLDGSLEIRHYVTHRLKGVAATNQAVDILHDGECLRCVVEY
eukprot:m.129524 g.129524  ORF g.129524 m.129524 type:complete len:691 (-) comp13890_c0_seq1:180-2252(-)